MRTAFVLTTTLLLSALAALTACRHSQLCCDPNLQPGLIGNWRLTRVEGGIAGSVITMPADSPVILTLNNDSSYFLQNKFLSVDTGTFTGTFHLADTPLYSSIPQATIIFSKGTPYLGAGPVSYDLSRDTLFLGSDFDDGYQAIYLKVY